MRTRVLLGAAVVLFAASGATAQTFNANGNLLIADQFNNRVIETDAQGHVIWHYGRGPANHSIFSPIGVNDAQRVGILTLMAATGAPPGTEPGCDGGCNDSRVLLVDVLGNIVWQYGQFGVVGSGPNQLNFPVQATWLPSQHVLVTDQGNQRVIEVTLDKRIVWQQGVTGEDGDGFNELSDPNSAELLGNGNILIADEGNNRAIEVNRNHQIVAQFSAQGTASGVAFASRLPNGHTLMADGGNNRAVEVDSQDHVVWQYVTNTEQGSAEAPEPSRAIRLANGNTVISDQFNHRVIIVDGRGNIVARFGNLNHPGYGVASTQQGLNAPYDAKVIGDYTGLTPPH